MKRLYIGGDSFCYYRKEVTDWPNAVAAKLGCELRGRGFPGDSWWLTRTNLLENLASFPDMQTFIFCHTNPHRPLSAQKLFKNHEAEQVKQQYLKYFADDEISLWTVTHWYQELNQLLAGRQVLHFQSFASSQEPFKLLEGTRVTTPLVELSLGADHSGSALINDDRRNHFSTEQNQLFAQQVLDCLASDKNDLQISWPS